MKLKRGQKLCKKCKCVNAARQRVCIDCNSEFKLTKSKLKHEIVNWKEELKPGDTFRIINGTGPYYVLGRDCGEGKKGEKLFVGCKGKYMVRQLDDRGIMATRLTALGRYEYIYMGKDNYCKELNIHRRAHRIVRITNPKLRKQRRG